MNAVEDPCKPEGAVQLRIGKLSQLANGSDVRLSNVITIRGIPWKLIADFDLVIGEKKMFSYSLVCNREDRERAWSHTCTATVAILAQTEGKEDRVRKYNQIVNVKNSLTGRVSLSFHELMNPENGWYDQATDSIILHAHIQSGAAHIYKQYTLRSEHSLCVETKDSKCNLKQDHCNDEKKSTLEIDNNQWALIYSTITQKLRLEMTMHESDSSKTTAELVFWYWSHKKIVILQKIVRTFGEAENTLPVRYDLELKTSKIGVKTNGIIPANNKFNVVIRLLDERIAGRNDDNSSLDSYYGDREGVDTVTLSVACGCTKAVSYVIPKLDLIRASPVFERMLANEMTERATDKVVIEDTNLPEFCAFLKAISPKQEHPNPSNVLALLKLADRYQCQLLRERCEAHLMNCVEIPLINLLKCANFCKLDKLKKNLLMSLTGTGLSKLHQQMKPYLDIMNEMTKMSK